MRALVENYILLFFVTAMLGWVMEVVCKLIQFHRFINRGFLIGPYCPIYGFGSVLITLLLSRYAESPVVVFLMGMIICGTLEYLTSYLMEKLFHARWWDYSQKRFNLNGRVCANTLIPFGLLGLGIIYGVKPFLFGLFAMIPQTAMDILCGALTAIILTDAVISTTVLGKIRHTAELTGGDDTETITRSVRDALLRQGALVRRTLRAFPYAKLYNKPLLERLRQGEAVRVWYSDQPDERCGLSWLSWELRRRGLQVPVYLVDLPRYEERNDGTLVRYISWGEMEPERFGTYVSRQREASPVLRSALAQEWETLRQENGPLRAVVNGRLCTVSADFYDFALRRVLAEQPEEFHQARAIGLALGKYLPGISDCYLALRMEAMLARGELEVVAAAPEDGPAYHRRLRKTAAFCGPAAE